MRHFNLKYTCKWKDEQIFQWICKYPDIYILFVTLPVTSAFFFIAASNKLKDTFNLSSLVNHYLMLLVDVQYVILDS